jgi:steroid delta-isomerase-like uncharacterized protein
MNNADIARRWFEEVWNQKRTDTVRELIGPDSVCDSEGGELRGPDAFIEQVHIPMLAAFPDLRMEVVGTTSEGTDVVVRWSARGTHLGDAFGIPPTGKRVAFRGMTWIRYRDGKMLEGLDCWNLAALQQALKQAETVASVVVE